MHCGAESVVCSNISKPRTADLPLGGRDEDESFHCYQADNHKSASSVCDLVNLLEYGLHLTLKWAPSQVATSSSLS
jgi:hypothetical protein